MKSSLFAAALAATACLAACVEIDQTLGGTMIPVSNTYKIVTPEPISIGVSQKMADSLSGFSDSRITIGSIRKDDEFGLTTRASVVSLVPLFDSDFDMGTDRIFKSMNFQSALDSISVEDEAQADIIQSVNVYEALRPVSYTKDVSCNASFPHGTARVSRGIPVITGNSDSLSFHFTSEFGNRYLQMTDADRADFSAYMKKYPGIYLETSEPLGQGGRINIFDLQLDYDSDYSYVAGNYAELVYSAVFDGERKDTSVCFYFSATDFYDLDSLAENSGTGNFPQYCLNLTGHDNVRSRARAGKAGETVLIEGGGGLKPVISAVELRKAMLDAISANGDDPSVAIINRASLNFHYEQDPSFEKMYKLPEILSPTCRIAGDTTVTFMGLTDASSSEEDQGDRNLSLYTFNPDITYHAQELINMSEDNAGLLRGSYDIWLLIMHNDLKTTTTSGNSEISQYYQYLAYQSYMGNMYGGYGGYGYGYGYGGYGSSYSNYYNYAMLAQMYGSSTTSTSSETNLDRDRYYYCRLYGPEASDESLRPTLTFTYSVPRGE